MITQRRLYAAVLCAALFPHASFAASPSDFGIVDPEGPHAAAAAPAPTPADATGAAPAPTPTPPAPEAKDTGKKNAKKGHGRQTKHATEAARARAAPAPDSAPERSPHGFGLGVIVGEPTGLTGKLWTGARSAVDFGATYSFRNYFLAYSDLLWHFDVFPKRDEFSRNTRLYTGIGGGLYLGSNLRFDVRVPVGLEWTPGRSPLGLFAEIVPAVRVAPNVQLDLSGGIGLRYYF